MPRSGPAPRRELAPDPVYRSVLVTQVTNKVLSQGKRTIAERIVYTALDTVKERTDSDPVAVLKRAVENVRPELEVRSRRGGGATYQEPVEVHLEGRERKNKKERERKRRGLFSFPFFFLSLRSRE